jgi:hypothetical protein
MRVFASDRCSGGVGVGASASNLFDGSGAFAEIGGGVNVGVLFLDFLGLVLTHGLSDFWALRSFSRAVPYLSSLVGQRLASAVCLCSTLFFPRQLTHLLS